MSFKFRGNVIAPTEGKVCDETHVFSGRAQQRNRFARTNDGLIFKPHHAVEIKGPCHSKSLPPLRHNRDDRPISFALGDVVSLIGLHGATL